MNSVYSVPTEINNYSIEKSVYNEKNICLRGQIVAKYYLRKIGINVQCFFRFINDAVSKER